MIRATTRNLAASIAALLLAGCASYQHPVAPLAAEARSAIGSLSVEMASANPVAPATPPPAPSRGEAALRGAGASLLGGMAAGAGTADPYGFILFTGLGIVAAPFVALGAAIAAPTDSSVPEAGAAIDAAITGIRWDAAFRDQVEKALAKQGRSIDVAPPADAGRLKLSIEGPWLVVDSYSAIPTLTVHGELVAGEACLIDRRWRWNGAADDYADLGEGPATAYRAQMKKGLAVLAEAVVADLLVSQKPRLTAYDAEAVAKMGGPPLLVAEPMEVQEQVGSWDFQSREPCSGILAPEDIPEPAPTAPALAPEPTAPEPPDHCREWGCRRDQ